ncbi:MAG: PAS domain S-box protein [Candidatus Heimdallarchaeota archaeon]|nr:PAS domain S-box protein [Candidatus Heimdallarchaeota archaeon]
MNERNLTKKELLEELETANQQIEELKQHLVEIKGEKPSLDVQENRYRPIFKQANDGILIISLNGHFLDVNPKAAEMLGYSIDDLIGLTATNIIAQKELPDSDQKWEALMAGKSLPLYERIFRRKDGSEFPAEINISVIKDKAGNPSYVQSIFRDITDRKIAEAEKNQHIKDLTFLSQSALQFLSFPIDSTIYHFIAKQIQAIIGSEFIIIISSFNDENDEFIIKEFLCEKELSKKLKKIVKANILGKRIKPKETSRKRIVQGKLVKFDLKDLTHSFVGKDHIHFERQLKELFSIGIVYSIGFISKEQILGLVKIIAPSGLGIANTRFLEAFVNQSAVALSRNKALKELQQSEMTNRMLLEQLADGVMIVTPDPPTIVYGNPALEEITGYSLEELQSLDRMGIRKLFHPEDIKLIADRFYKRVRGRSPIPPPVYDFRMIKKDGSEIWVTVISKQIAYNNKPAILGILRDITSRKQAEKEIKRLNEELEKRVQKRTEQLREINKELEAFTYSVSHDLRTPIRQILSFIDLLEKRMKKESYSEKVTDYIKRINDSAVKMNQLIEALLNLSKMSQISIVSIKVNLNKVVDDVLQSFQSEIKERNVQIIKEPLPEVFCDPGLIRIVFNNLVSNALKFTRPRENAIVTIGLSSETTEDIAIIYVKDNGVGFNPKYNSKLFQVFQRLHEDNKFEGTGIGLATVKRIINRHGGKIWAEGAIDKGATFYFYLQRKRINSYID